MNWKFVFITSGAGNFMRFERYYTYLVQGGTMDKSRVPNISPADQT